MKFNLDNNELLLYNNWLKTKDLNLPCGAIGGRFTFSFTPTSMGTIIKIVDNIDKSEIDITDYESW